MTAWADIYNAMVDIFITNESHAEAESAWVEMEEEK